MSQYFRRQKANPVERRYMSTAHTALDHSLLNSDLETNSCAIVKLRLQKNGQKPPQAPQINIKKKQRIKNMSSLYEPDT